MLDIFDHWLDQCLLLKSTLRYFDNQLDNRIWRRSLCSQFTYAHVEHVIDPPSLFKTWIRERMDSCPDKSRAAVKSNSGDLFIWRYLVFFFSSLVPNSVEELRGNESISCVCSRWCQTSLLNVQSLFRFWPRGLQRLPAIKSISSAKPAETQSSIRFDEAEKCGRELNELSTRVI